MTVQYRVLWEIDIEADTPREAAEKALAIHRKPDSIATVFDVTGPDGQTTTVDFHPETMGDWPEEAATAPDPRDVLRRLLAWHDTMGGWDAPVWRDAEAVINGEAQP